MINDHSISDLTFERIKKRRQKAENRYYEKITFRENEQYNELTSRINKINRLIGKALSEGKDHKNLSKEKKELEQKRNRLFPETLSSPEYFCKKCNDTGYVNGKTCECFKKLYSELLCEKLGIPSQEKATFEKETLSKKVPTLGNTYIKYSNLDFPDIVSSVFIGLCGTGKTYLAECIASKFEQEKNVLFLSAFNLNNILVKYHSAPVEEKPFYFSTLTECDLLIIDDLGSEPIYNKVTVEYLFALFEERRKNGNPFIVTTNLNLSEILSRYGERVFSRLVQKGKTEIIHFDCANLRNI